MNEPPYPIDEIARRGEEIYAREIRAKVADGNKGKIVTIDIESGDYEMDDDHLETLDRLQTRKPHGVFYSLRVGFPALAKVGGWGPIEQ